MKTALNYQLFLRYCHITAQINVAQAKQQEQGMLDVMQEEQAILFASLNEDTKREMIQLEQIREFEKRLDMSPATRYCPYHEDSFRMTWNGHISYTQDSKGNITGAYRNIECPRCHNTEMEGVNS